MHGDSPVAVHLSHSPPAVGRYYVFGDEVELNEAHSQRRIS